MHKWSNTQVQQACMHHVCAHDCPSICNGKIAAHLWSASLSLNAGWEVAFLPLSHPWLSKTTAGDAQIADQIFPDLICSFKICRSAADLLKRSAPGMPPFAPDSNLMWESQKEAIMICLATDAITGRVRCQCQAAPTGSAMASKDSWETSPMSLSATSFTFRDISTCR